MHLAIIWTAVTEVIIIEKTVTSCVTYNDLNADGTIYLGIYEYKKYRHPARRISPIVLLTLYGYLISRANISYTNITHIVIQESYKI